MSGLANRISQKTAYLKTTGGKSFSSVIMIGDPDIETTFELVKIAADVGVDVIETGIPIAKPFLDSTSMRDSMVRALRYTKDYEFYLDAIGKLRQNFPDVIFEIMIYHETIMDIGLDKFCQVLAAADMDCVLVADAVFKGEDFLNTLDKKLLDKGVYPIRFVPHPFNPGQLEDLKKNAKGFIVVQTKTDPQGRRDTVQEENKHTLLQIRQAGIDLPLVFAYGIKTPTDVRRCIDLGADGVLVGTILLDAAHQLSKTEYKKLLISLRHAADQIQ
jgi:tryptophan synthase alpha chain